jgi:hypothetical protein
MNETGQKTRDIVEEGGEIRDRVRETFVQAASNLRGTGRDLIGIARDMLAGAAQGVKDSIPEEQESVLRQVVDGIGEGLTTTANATRMAIEEAESKGRAFAETDLKNAREEMSSLGSLFVDSVADTARSVRTTTKDQVESLRKHAERTYASAEPSIRDALKAALHHPGALAGQSVDAGAKAAFHAAGGLFGAVAGALDAVRGKKQSGNTASGAESTD